MERWILFVAVTIVTSTLLVYRSYSGWSCSYRMDEVAKLRQSLELVLAQLQTLGRRHARLASAVRRAPWLLNASAPRTPFTISYEGGPTEEYEMLRKRVYSSTQELWYFIRHKIRMAVKDGVGRKRILESTVQEVAERKRWLIWSQEELPRADGRDAWRRREAVRAGDLVRRRLHYLQHPPDCSQARKIVCPYEWGCGFTCSMHYLAVCLVYAYGTERVLVLKDCRWSYGRGAGWARMLRPLSENCTRHGGSYEIPGSEAEPTAMQLHVPVSLYRSNRGHGIPLHKIPQDLAHRIVRFSSEPGSWWVGQVIKYLIRLQPHIEEAVVDTIQKMDFSTPIVGIHIRRTDKLYVESKFHPLEEYMREVEDYFLTLEQTRDIPKRRVYLATDDVSVINEAKLKYPQYKFYSNHSRAVQAAPKNRHNLAGLTGLLVDIYALAKCDYVVCTLSSNIGRTVHKLLHDRYIDAANRFTSLDITDHYYRGEALRRVAVMRNADIAFNVGDEISSMYWNYNSDGFVPKTKITGRIPWYKTEAKLDLYPFPEYLQVPTY